MTEGGRRTGREEREHRSTERKRKRERERDLGKLTISISAANDNRHARQKLEQATSSNDITHPFY